MKKAVVIVLIAGATLTGCNPMYTYEAEPIGQGEKCFNIERESDMDDDDEKNLGTFCRQGYDASEDGQEDDD